jgi:DNA-binding transcriptional ArsR family regulator
MNPKDINLNDMSFQKLVHDENYYKYIFKKTEKIVAAVFYILNNVDSNNKTESHVSNIASKAHLVHEHSLRTLEVKRASGREVLEQFAQALIALESTFRVATATGLISPEVLRTVLTEVDTVLRGLRSYITIEGSPDESFLAFRDERSAARPRATASSPRPRSNSDALPSASPSSRSTESGADRRSRIKTIIEAKGEATIKDISEIITDVSEKTIQRELQAMIEDNLVKRQGERRWSRYSLF